MPQMGESIAEGTLSKWLKRVGDEVKRDEPIFEISTDKVDAEIPAPAAGVLAEILVTEGQTVAVQTVVARLETEKGAAVGVATAAPAPSVSAAPVGAGAPPVKQATTSPSPDRHPSPAPATIAAPANGNGLEERLRTRSSPLVRKIAAEHGVEIGAMRGSGIQGRVTKRDIEQYLASGAAATAGQRPSMHAPAGAATHGPAPEPWAGDRVEPMSKIRALTSDHMVASRHTNAHVTSFFEIDLTRIARIRHKNRAAFEAQTGQKLTYLPFIIKTVVDTLKQFPVLNAAVAGNSIIYRKQYNIGIAVALDWGLIVPVIKGADDLSLSGLTKNLNDLADRARTKRLKPEEVQQATFTITNPGVFGSLMGTPIIPLGTSAILGLGAIEKRPKVITGPDGEDTIAIRTCAYFSLSFDHRIVDGADADRFLAAVKAGLESFPETAL
ncbi:MAG: 2-oxo acid dehydrogenase subunit E2 [Gemmatimonadaceae bacterium]|nr:2-oxo acid dehydrogenase subunit E2 [Gemmatimonadaceae bacterium]NUO93873.1 2-oxo acid dehydrogenase subunit E2 [Gemmatimonadaceae bacterium]NUP70986.1 2-oxo acid dehydrogenase subunit E2 [Gemmatimonadaceae bacterium]NUS31548.1 2-oxo acid dehydrogenase subunit E2 [Gemmatimonadaceae bacterium]